jgi:hypothetical protein
VVGEVSFLWLAVNQFVAATPRRHAKVSQAGG